MYTFTFSKKVKGFKFKPGDYVRYDDGPRLVDLIPYKIYKVIKVTEDWEVVLKNQFGRFDKVHQSSCSLEKRKV